MAARVACREMLGISTGLAGRMVAGAVRAESREAVDVGGDEADIARAALQRIERRHFGEAEVAVHAVELASRALLPSVGAIGG